ncbi:MAG TPA: lytic murein transglycosylase B [Steroidobacteraceae bacterium]|nr:lytic murein transglycosylase B [Steroidobacteraceae bacterium]
MTVTSARAAFRALSGALLLVAVVGADEPPAVQIDPARPSVQAFIARMSAQHGFSTDELTQLFAQAKTQQAILDAMSKPTERALAWYEYRARFLTEQRIADGAQFWAEHRELLDETSKRYAVAPQYLIAILGVETSYGRIMGRYRVLDALSTLAFDYPARSAYFTSELEQFLLLTREESLDALAPVGSYAGAMGAPQFMPGSLRRFGVDADGDGKRDLWTDWADILGSIGNYFHVHGWQADGLVLTDVEIDQAHAHDLDSRPLALDETVASLKGKGVQFHEAVPDDAPAMLIAADEADEVRFRVGLNNFYVITRYNRSPLYAMAVYELANRILERTFRDEPPPD